MFLLYEVKFFGIENQITRYFYYASNFQSYIIMILNRYTLYVNLIFNRDTRLIIISTAHILFFTQKTPKKWTSLRQHRKPTEESGTEMESSPQTQRRTNWAVYQHFSTASDSPTPLLVFLFIYIYIFFLCT